GPEGEYRLCSQKIPGGVAIGAILSYEGNLPLGPTLERGLVEAVVGVNAAGGVYGEELGLGRCNTRGAVPRTPAAMEELAGKATVGAVIAAVENGPAMEAASIAIRDKIPLVVAMASTDAIATLADDGWVFRTAPSAKVIGGIISSAIVHRNIQRVSAIV